MCNDMSFDKQEWNNTKIEEMHTTKKKDNKGNTNEVIFIIFEDRNDVKNFKSQLKNVSDEINKRIIPYVSQKAFERFQTIDHITYKMRRRGKKTKVVFTKYDFILLSKDKNDETNWYNVPPRILEDLPEFKVGKISEEEKIEEEKQRDERKNKMIKINNEIKEDEMAENNK